MKRILLAGASIVALGTAPVFAQAERAGALECSCPGSQVEAGVTNPGMHASSEGASTSKDSGLAEEATADTSTGSNSDFSAASSSTGEMPFPPQDVSDDDLEPHGTEYPSGYPASAVAGVGEPGLDESEQASVEDEDEIWEGGGEIGPNEEIRDRSERRGVDDGDRSAQAEGNGMRNDDRREQRQLSAEEGPAFAWDGPSEGAPFHRGELHPDRSEAAAVSGSGERRTDEGANAGADAADRDRRAERRLQLARIARRTARHAVPEANFRTYNFEVENGRPVIEIAGIDRTDGRRIEVDVRPNGRVQSISKVIAYDQVPRRIRNHLAEELNGFRPAHVQRSILDNFDVHYEFAGFSRSGRPVAASIRADGTNLRVRYIRRSS